MAGKKKNLIIIYPLKQKLHPGGKGEKYYFMPPSLSGQKRFIQYTC